MAEEYGRVAITPRGDWSETKQYEAGDIVTYNKGSSYLAHTTPPVGTLPTNEGYYQVSALGGSLATADAPGVVKPDNVTLSVDEEDGTISVNTASQTGLGAVKGSDDITVESDGQLRVNTDFAQAVDLANIIAGEAIKEVFGKVAKSIAVTMGLNENALLKGMLSNQYENDSNKIPTSALVCALKQITDTLNSDLANLATNVMPNNCNKADGGYATSALAASGWTSISIPLSAKLSEISYVQVTVRASTTLRTTAPIVTGYNINTVTVAIYNQETTAVNVGVWALVYGK